MLRCHFARAADGVIHHQGVALGQRQARTIGRPGELGAQDEIIGQKGAGAVGQIGEPELGGQRRLPQRAVGSEQIGEAAAVRRKSGLGGIARQRQRVRLALGGNPPDAAALSIGQGRHAVGRRQSLDTAEQAWGAQGHQQEHQGQQCTRIKGGAL